MARQDINQIEEEMHQANQAEIARRKQELQEEIKALGDDPYGARKLMKEIQEREMVNHPDHYQGNKFEVIDIIEDYELGFSLGNAIKYILRSDKKGARKQDLQKAIWYIQREINREDL
jgi:plasmid stabilization system protein ParE